jgi:hypothetical protein
MFSNNRQLLGQTFFEKYMSSEINSSDFIAKLPKI